MTSIWDWFQLSKSHYNSFVAKILCYASYTLFIQSCFLRLPQRKLMALPQNLLHSCHCSSGQRFSIKIKWEEKDMKEWEHK